MTPERRRDFETEWPNLEARLHKMLARRGVPRGSRDDVVQETATRLFANWEAVDRSRSAWPLTKVIALNLLRDQARRRYEEVSCEVPEVAGHHCVEAAGIARLDLQRVGRALNGFSPEARAALLKDFGDQRSGCSSAAEKMQRMRARKRLRVMLERAPVAVSLRFARFGELGEWLAGGRAALANGLSCAACAAIGLAMAFPGGDVLTRPDRVQGETEARVRNTSTLEHPPAAVGEVGLSLTVRDAHDLVVATHSPSKTSSATPEAKPSGQKSAQQMSGSQPGGGGGLVPVPSGAPPLPTNGYGPEAGPASPNVDPSGAVKGSEAPGVPGPGPGESSPVGALSETRDKLEETIEAAL